MSEGTFLLRPANAGDASALGRLHAACWQESYADIVPAAVMAALSVAARTALWASVLEPGSTSSTSVLVAERASEMVGFGACGPQREPRLARDYGGEISALYVRRNAQAGGIGSGLLRGLANNLAGRNLPGVALWVLRENGGARTFYERHGGVVLGEREDVRAGGTLHEVAYGWRDLARLVAG